MYEQKTIAENFAQHNIIFVIFGYRLGIMGFWTTGTHEAQGNYAIQGKKYWYWRFMNGKEFNISDMLLALQWTHKEISNFGGDPQRITAVGHSAGANALALLTLIPETEGLFQQALIMSESASKRPWFDNNLNDFRTAAILVGCWPKDLVWPENLNHKYLNCTISIKKVL